MFAVHKLALVFPAAQFLLLALPDSAGAAGGGGVGSDGGGPSRGRVLYEQPSGAIDVPSHVFPNPRPWPRPALLGHTASVMWQRGDVGGVAFATPTSAPLSQLTGTDAKPAEQALGTGQQGVAPWTGVQLTQSGVWGAAINTTGADPAMEHLTTTTIESGWYGRGIDPSKCAAVFADGGSLSVEFDLKVPSAFKLSAANSCAVYVSMSVYLKSMPVNSSDSRFVWYSTNVFDFERNHVDNLFIDKSSDKLIVSSVIKPGSRYISAARTSSLSSNQTWSDWKHFSYTIDAEQVERGISDGLAKFKEHFANSSLRLPTNAREYCVPGFNLELEATPGAGAGLSARGITIRQQSGSES
jgi:hypothetical protein